jgi:TRAP-type mannitol/chloroaromatic compound transport system permease small subunit
MNFLLRLSSRIDTVNRWIGVICSYLIVPLTLIVVYEVLSRFFNHPTIWSFEMSNFFYGTYFMLVAAYGLLYKSHVAIDLFSGRFSTKTQAALSLICYAFMYFPFIAVFLYFGVSYAANSWQMTEKSWSIWGPYIYPIKTVIPITAVLLLLQGISEVIKTVDILVHGRREAHES